MRFHTIANYLTTARTDFLKTVEDFVDFAYVDTAQIATIGIGLNLQVHGRLVLQSLGFDLDGSQLTGDAFAAEQQYITRLLNAFNQQYPSNITQNNQAFAAFNVILQERAIDLLYPSDFGRPTEFRLASLEVGQQLMNQALDGYNVTGTNSPGYESIVDTWLTRTGLSTQQPGLTSRDNRERLALLSLGFNSKVFATNDPNTSWNDVGLPTLLGPLLTKALLNDDRAEAWYQIRYESGTDTARRFLEADTFNLYDSGPLGEADYKAAYRILTRHRTKIFGADQTAGAGNDDFEFRNSRGLTTAENRGTILGIDVKGINAHLAQAQEFLAGTYGVGVPVDWSNIFVGEDLTTAYYKPSTGDKDVLDGTAQSDLMFGESGDDLLDGKGGDDVLYGGANADRLIGGAGDDWLIGGTGDDPLLDGGVGNDTYVWNSGDGLDTDRGRPRGEWSQGWDDSVLGPVASRNQDTSRSREPVRFSGRAVAGYALYLYRDGGRRRDSGYRETW